MPREDPDAEETNGDDCVDDVLHSYDSISSRLYMQQKANTTTSRVHHSNSNSNITFLHSQINIEVKPNVFMELRSAMETLRAIEAGLASCAVCAQCHGILKCVPDAEVVMCPDCRITSPMGLYMEDDSMSEQPHNILVGRRGGVGLGLKIPLSEILTSST